MPDPPHRDSVPRFKKFTEQEEALLYGVSTQVPVNYPPVVLPEGEVSRVVEELNAQPFPPVTQPKRGLLETLGIRRITTLRRIQVGLDFGTSTTKVMYRELGVAEPRVRILNFKHGLSDYPDYCMPSVATFDKRANLYLGDSAVRQLAPLGWGAGLSRLKMLIAGRVEERYLDRAWHQRFLEHVNLAFGDDSSCTPEALAATFLATVMRRIRIVLQNEYGAEKLDLIFNTCVPVDQSERTPVVRAFERVIATAAYLEQNSSTQEASSKWLETAMKQLPEMTYDIEDDAQRIFLMPEAVATAAGYITSIRRTSGIHAIVDIGAGTTDVSICLLTLAFRGGATTFWYAARSIPMGAARIEGMLANVLARSGALVSQELIHRGLSGDPLLASECRTLVRDELTRIWNGTVKAWSDAYGHDAQESAWTKEAIKVFLTGGGALIPAARTVFAQSWMQRWGPYPCEIIPTPETFDARSAAPFHRLSVAFGLATPLPELGTNVMPSKSPNHTPPKPAVRHWRQEGDQILPRWGWT
jgi:hypothetical protein